VLVSKCRGVWKTIVNQWLLIGAGLAACSRSVPSTPAIVAASETDSRVTQAVRILGFNDFHGNLSTTRTVDDRPVGGAAVLATYLERAQDEVDGHALIVHAGDQVGASPPISGLLQDEPSIEFLNLLGNAHCNREHGDTERCNVVGTLGNHEFDEGRDELLRLLRGGNSVRGPFLQAPYRGAAFAYVCANVLDARTHQPLLPPYAIRRVGTVRVGVVGAVVRETPTIVNPAGVSTLVFLDEADAINAAVRELKRQGVRAIVVSIHQGGDQPPYTGPTREQTRVEGEIMPILRRLDDEVDVVVSGHSHRFSNAFVRNSTGKRILLTQALSAGMAFAQIDVQVDLRTGDIVHKQAQIVTTFADVVPSALRHPEVDALVRSAQALVGPKVNRVVGSIAATVRREPGPSGESALGNLVADAQRAMVNSDFALTNLGGIRSDLEAGEITWGELYSIQPFGNRLVQMQLTGSQLVQLLEQQWQNTETIRMLQISGFEYSWDDSKPPGEKVVEVRVNGAPIDRQRAFSVVVNDFMAAGGDEFRGGLVGVDRITRGGDLEALVRYVEQRAELRAEPDGRILRIDSD
jgi:5'-nucleotidase